MHSGGPLTRPVLRVVRGEPTPEQLAALVTLVTAATAAAAASSAQSPAPLRSAWGDRAAAFRAPVRVGPGGWRASGWRPGTRSRAAW
jgi:hypothetical protein